MHSGPYPSIVFITGGVISSLGKGLTSAALAYLLESRDLKVGMMKLDPYFNVDPGTMSPYQHGEVYVTDDGAETDLDLGHYWRFTNFPIKRVHSTSSGQIFLSVIEKERQGAYEGQTVQMIPHITEEIKKRILTASTAQPCDLFLVEIGGTAGDIESLPFLEAIRQLSCQEDLSCLNLHMTYIPYVKAAGELKTKPTQQSMQLMRSIGIFPDLLVCRSEKEVPKEAKEKIALFCNLPAKAVFVAQDVKGSIYEVPLDLHEEKVDEYILNKLQLPIKPCDITPWKSLLEKSAKATDTCRIAVVGKYIEHDDAYKSIYEALSHAAMHAPCQIDLIKISPDQKNLKEQLRACDGVLIPGGFGKRGWEGKIDAVEHCIEAKIPYFGICLGMQALCVGFARHKCGLKQADSAEFSTQATDKIVDLMESQKADLPLGGSMRLGSFTCRIKKGTLLHKIYGKDLIHERHRHRYELNQEYCELLESKGLAVSGTCAEMKGLPETVEYRDHPWMVGVQYHPEFKSKVLEPHPLFSSFIEAALKQKQVKESSEEK